MDNAAQINNLVSLLDGYATKGGHPPKSLKTAIKMLKNEQKLAKGAN